MTSIENFLADIKNKSIHIVGVTGAEGSNILRLLRKYNIENITVHDFLSMASLEKSFKLWHKGMNGEEREKQYKQFLNDLRGLKLCSRENYLKNILEADLIFVPQSWRLYKENDPYLFEAERSKIPFYTITRLYLDYSKAIIIGITGTVGKGSTAHLLTRILETAHKKTYFAGNETWMPQVADKLDEMEEDDILVLEISHRQLQDGFSHAPHIVVMTNLFPNHLDEMDWEKYKRTKFSLLEKQKQDDFTVINYDNINLRNNTGKNSSKIVYFSAKNIEMNIKNVQKIYQDILYKNGIHYLDNILAASTVACLLNIDSDAILTAIYSTNTLPARLEYLGQVDGVKFYDDIKSTTPWATMAALDKLGKNTILICGGKTKGINYQELVKKIKGNIKYIYIIKSELSADLSQLLPKKLYEIVDSLEQAMRLALKKAKTEDNILVSPAGAFFYTDFIKGKHSVKKLFISLLPKEQSEEVRG